MLGFWLLVGVAAAGWVFGLPRRWLLGALVLAWAVIEDSIHRLVAVWEGDEAPEGIAAFFDKRKPRWQV